MTSLQYHHQTEIADFYIVASSNGLRGIYWAKQDIPLMLDLKKSNETPQSELIQRAVSQIQEYLAGTRTAFDLPLELEGTPFQKKVWSALQLIPYGETRSYREIAQMIDHASAVRAVGSANGCNPLSLVIPCHRVIAASGKLGGYNGGLTLKSKLLALEKTAFAAI